MELDVFFSISQTPVDGRLPTEAEMFRNFLVEVEAADQLGYGVAWVAESHLSSEVQKRNRRPVVPHWQGEIGLNTNLPLLASYVFQRTRRIEVGSAVSNVVCMGGPVAAAEKVAASLALHGLDPAERRRLHVGFANGRFDFMNEAGGIVPRSALEAAAWPALKGRIFREAAEIFVRLLRGDVLSSDDVAPTVLTRTDFRDDADWAAVSAEAGGASEVEIPRRWVFEALEIVPRDWRRELLQLVIGSHDPVVQEAVNAWAPVQVFNLSITRPEVIEDTHRRLTAAYHSDGGPWRRAYLPRTVMVFLDDTVEAAQARSRAALSAYWTALEGTLDPRKVEAAADNALVGDAAAVVEQARARFHPEDRLMLWFDFFDHDVDRVIRGMRDFRERVAPHLGGP